MYLAMDKDSLQLLTQAQQAQTAHSDMQFSAESNGLYLQTYNFDAINDIRHEIEPFIDRLTFKSYEGKFNTADILKRISSNKQQIWLARDYTTDEVVMVCITEVVEYPQKKALYISDVVGANSERWLWVDEEITKWARQIGCSLIEARGRLGWLKKVPKGYKAESISFKKDL